MRSSRCRLFGCAFLPLLFLGVLGQSGIAGAAACPDPKTCDRYVVLNHMQWPLDADGRATISYWVNPTQPWLPEAQAVAAIRAAFSTWQTAVPGVRFDYKGITRLLPVPNDGMNVIGWAPWTPGGATWISGNFKEADMWLSLPYATFRWYPCEQRDGSCTYLYRDFLADWEPTAPVWPFGNGAKVVVITDVQNIVTHEVGHWLGLADLYDAASREMTMFGIIDIEPNPGNEANVERKKATLALGDVLGARSLYPCTCSVPVIFSP